MTDSKKIILAAVLFLGLFTLYGLRLHFPSMQYYDEVYHVRSARELISLSGYFDVAQPPLGKLLISLGMIFLGDNGAGWRIFPLLFGLGYIILLYFLTLRLTSCRMTAFFAAALLALDCSLVPLSRIAMLNTPMQVFMLLSLFVLTFYEKSMPSAKRRQIFLLSGLFLGLAFATRIFAVTMPGVLALYLVKIYRDNPEPPQTFLKEIFFYFLVIPVLVYFGVHLIIPFIKGKNFADIFRLQWAMFKYHLTLKAPHRYGSAWWSWPLMIRPIWYYFLRTGDVVRGILCIGNPAIYWMIPTTMLYTAWIFLRKRTFLEGFLLGSFLLQWVPWAFLGRVQFFHYFETAIPFAVISLALVLKRAWNESGFGQFVVIVYGLMVLGMFAYWYPLLTGLPISEGFFRNHMWLRSWI